MKIYVIASVMLYILLASMMITTGAFCSVLDDPGVQDGEYSLWRKTSKEEGKELEFAKVTWHKKEIDGKPVYEITEDWGEDKQASYILDRSDMRLIRGEVVRNTEDGRSEVTIKVEGERQYLVHKFKDDTDDKKIDYHTNSYNGVVLQYSLRGFPFETEKEVEIRITPPFSPRVPLWIWKMWKSYAKLVGEEKVTVPAGTFDCYKLETAASGGIIRRFTSEYYTWYTKEPPHYFVKYQDKDGKSITELAELKIPESEETESEKK
jgi:hypothetical protein